MRRRHLTTTAMPIERPTDREVEVHLEAALISAHDAMELYKSFPEVDRVRLAARRFITRFPPYTTADQIERALNTNIVLPRQTEAVNG